MGKKPQVLDTRSKVQRKEARHSLGLLQDLIISPRTHIRYKDAIKKWLQFLLVTRRPFPQAPAAVDTAVSEYISNLWEEGEGKALAANTLAGIQHFVPALRFRLPCGWRLYKAWNKAELPSRAPPLTLPLLHALCGRSFLIGRPDIAISLLIGFEAMLRTGELLALTKNDIDIAEDHSSVVLNLGATKVGIRLGVSESVTFSNSFVAKLMAARLLSLSPGDLLLPKGQADFRKVFQALLDAMGLGDFGFKPYSLRRGGATALFRALGVLSPVVIRGRWTNARTARIYINEGLATLASYSFDLKEASLAVATQEFVKRTAKAAS